MKPLAIALFLSLFCLSVRADSLADVKTRKELRIGVQAGYVPFAMRKPDGTFVGYEVDMMKAFAERLGVAVKFVDTKWEGIIPALHVGKFDAIVSGMSITPERAKSVLFSDPYYKAGLMLMVAKKHVGKVQSLLDCETQGLSVGVQLGTTGDFYAAKALKKAKLVKMDLESDAANAVLLGKLDAFVFDAPYLQLFARRHQGKVQLVPDLLSEEGLGLAARKKDTALVAEFNRFIVDWKKSGGADKTAKAFFEDMIWLKDFPQLMH